MLDSVWRAAVRAVKQRDQRCATATTPWDLKKCFERVDRDLLWRAAAEVQFPLALLRESLATYGWPRAVRLGDLMGPYVVL